MCGGVERVQFQGTERNVLSLLLQLLEAPDLIVPSVIPHAIFSGLVSAPGTWRAVVALSGCGLVS